jgi:hypothetical protein
MHVEAGELLADVLEQVEIPLFGQLGVMAALHENLRAAKRDGLLDLAVEFLPRDHVAVGVLLRAVERAELAIDVADVGVIDIAIDDVGDDLVAAPAVGRGTQQLPATVGQSAEFFQRERVKPAGFLAVDAVAVPDFLQERVE